MNLSSSFIKRPVMTTLLMLTIAFFGSLCYQSLPISDMPDVEFPSIQVSITYPGADPTTISNNVISPLEQQFATMPGIQMISSTSQTGSATILLQFELNRSIDLAAPDVLAAINAASSQLPKDLPYATYLYQEQPYLNSSIDFCSYLRFFDRGRSL
jgi:Cation/multidrug efflux pump